MNIATIETAVADIVKDVRPETFIFQLLAAYGKPKASITRLQKGNLNLSKTPGEVVWKKNVLFRAIDGKPNSKAHSDNPIPLRVSEKADSSWDLHALTDRLRKSDAVSKHAARFVITTDWHTLLAVDTKTAETLDVPIAHLHKHVHFFLPWAGLEKHVSQGESLADIKAAYKMAKLYDQIIDDNPGLDAAGRHSLNVFLSRLLFCYFAEDTEIFPTRGMFTASVLSHTQEDGSDLHDYLDKLFEVMNTESRSDYPAFLQAFPYVNGGLLSEKHAAPKFSRQSRKLIKECGELDWSEINPDIFGSMMQAVVHCEERAETGMHYTSVSNIMKVLGPLLLDELHEEFVKNSESSKGLEALLKRLYNIKVFDPACGSGNFLIIAYKELRKLEMAIYQRLREINIYTKGVMFLPRIRLTQFYGIEIDDFAHEIAVLSMWLAEHQMNVKFRENFGQIIPPLPLKPSGYVVCDNAARIDWNKVCSKDPNCEIFVLGNPPYLGARNQSPLQKRDVEVVLGDIKGANNLDYIACWFHKAADYIKGACVKSAFVTTNSICQGEQVSLLWPHIVLQQGLEIGFAYQSFKWENNAKHNAGVTVTIIGLRNKEASKKHLFSDAGVKTVDNISPYLIEGRNTVVYKVNESICGLPPMCFGSMPNDGGNFFLSKEAAAKLIADFPESQPLVKRMYGADQFISGDEEYCLWIEDRDKELAETIPPIKQRIDQVRKLRLGSTRGATQKLADTPHRFGEVRHRNTHSIIVPCHTSERREYVPFGFLDNDNIILNSAQAIYDPEPWLFALISSKLHNVWVRTVGGKLEERIRYSSGLCYNPFPVPELTKKQHETLATHAFNVLSEREKHPEKTIAQLYDPDLMPPDLLQAHRDLDLAVERCYASRTFANDQQRIDFLFEMYERLWSAYQRGNGRA